MNCIYCNNDPVLKVNCYCRPIYPDFKSNMTKYKKIFDELQEARASGDKTKQMLLKIELNCSY